MVNSENYNIVGGRFMKDRQVTAYNADIHTQLIVLEKIILSSKILYEAIHRARLLDIKNYYIGAGCIAQTVWNYLSNKPLDYGIDDIDFAYFDQKNLGYSAENEVIQKVHKRFSDLNTKIDVKNQARVHLWYEGHFGYPMKPYLSLESALNTWPTTATAIGVRLGKNNELKVYAPFGLNDLFGKIVRPNKTQITENIYSDKVKKWIQKWPDLEIIPWET